jgi:hypothetical protein
MSSIVILTGIKMNVNILSDVVLSAAVLIIVMLSIVMPSIGLLIKFKFSYSLPVTIFISTVARN